jgi:hypothetical protein
MGYTAQPTVKKWPRRLAFAYPFRRTAFGYLGFRTECKYMEHRSGEYVLIVASAMYPITIMVTTASARGQNGRCQPSRLARLQYTVIEGRRDVTQFLCDFRNGGWKWIACRQLSEHPWVLACHRTFPVRLERERIEDQIHSIYIVLLENTCSITR